MNRLPCHLFQEKAVEKNQGIVLRFTSCQCSIIVLPLEIEFWLKIVMKSFLTEYNSSNTMLNMFLESFFHILIALIFLCLSQQLFVLPILYQNISHLFGCFFLSVSLGDSEMQLCYSLTAKTQGNEGSSFSIQNIHLQKVPILPTSILISR